MENSSFKKNDGRNAKICMYLVCDFNGSWFASLVNKRNLNNN